MLDLTFQGIEEIKENILFRAFWNLEFLKVKKREIKLAFPVYLLLCLALR